jgi:hypothetical protein
MPNYDWLYWKKQAETYKAIYEREQKISSTLGELYRKENADRIFLTQVLDDIGDVVCKTEGYCWYDGIYYDSLFALFRDTVGVEFGWADAG